MARMDKLWKAVGGPGTPPAADSRAVKARVNAVLDADRKESRIYMRQKLRIAIGAAAVALAVTGSALAVTNNWDVIQAFFQGDTAPAQEYVDSTPRSVNDENYTLTVDSSMSDGNNMIYLITTLTANNTESKDSLFSEDLLEIAKAVFVQSAEQAVEGLPGCRFSARIGELKAPDENSRRFRLRVSVNQSEPVSALLVGSEYMDRDIVVEVPISPAPSITVDVGASGTGIPLWSISTPGTLTIERVILSPFTCRIECSNIPLSNGYSVEPRIFFRLADGSIRTQSQMMDYIQGGGDSYDANDVLTYGNRYFVFEFDEVQDLENIISVIAFDMEYPLDGSAPIPLEHDPNLDPFILPAMEPLSEQYGYSFSVQALVRGLGGTCNWNPTAGTMTCTYRGVTLALRASDITAMVDGNPVTMLFAPAVQDDTLTASAFLFETVWDIDCLFFSSGASEEPAWGNWYIVP